MVGELLNLRIPVYQPHHSLATVRHTPSDNPRLQLRMFAASMPCPLSWSGRVADRMSNAR